MSELVTGSGANGVVLVLPSKEASTHAMFARLLRRAGLNREGFAVHIGVDGLASFLATRPDIKVVVPMGEQVLSRLIGETEILRWRGRAVWAPSYQRWVIPTLSPLDLIYQKAKKGEGKKKAPIQNPPRFTRVCIEDLHFALHVAREGYARDSSRDYLYDPDPERFRQWVDVYLHHYAEVDRECYLSFDIETPYKQKNRDESELEEGEMDDTIIRISFSYAPHSAVTVPWDAAHLPGIRTLLGSPGKKVVWNGMNFDIPLIQKVGVDVAGTVYDFMDGFKALHSDLPKGLEWVTSFFTDLLPWKHLNNADPQLYSCIDADAALRNAIGIEAKLKAQKRWNTFLRHSVYLMPILKEAGDRGNVVDEQARLELEKEMMAEEEALVREIQMVVPDSLRPRKRYKKDPANFAELEDHGQQVYILKDADGNARRFEKAYDRGKVKVCSACGAKGITKGDHFKGGKKNPCKAAGADILTVEDEVVVWDELLDFNPNSSDQLIAYMKHYGHPVGQIFDDPDGESADSKHLKKLEKKYGKKHPVYGLTLKAHKVSKALGTYVRGLKPDANGLVHTTYVNSPSTWRLGSRDVNMQNQGKRGTNPYAKRSRKLIVARPGHVLVQADSSSIEAVMVGWLMGDPDYIALAKQSIHAWLCCRVLGWDFNPENVEKIKKEHKGLYDQMKVTNHMCLTGDHEVLTPKGWVRFDQYDFATPIAEWDGKGGVVEFRVPKGRTVKPYEGKLLDWEGRAFSASMTPNHHLPVIYDSAQKEPHYLEAQHVTDTARLPVTGSYRGGIAVDSHVARLVAAVQADGCVVSKAGAVQFRFKRQRKIERMRQLAHGRHYSVRKDASGVTTFYFPAKSMKDVLCWLTPEKTFDLPKLLTWDYSARRTFLAEVTKWDGTEAEGEGEQTTYLSKVEGNAVAVQTIAHISDQQALLRRKSNGLYSVSFNYRQRTRVGSMKRTERDFNGTVYCVTTETGYFLVRRNGKVWVSGNTNYGGTPPVLVEQFPEVFPELKDARRAQQYIFDLLPQLGKWHHEMRVRAQKETFLESPWGHRHEFYDVFTQLPDGRIRYGKDSKRCIAFLPQNSAGCFMRDNLLIMGTRGDEVTEAHPQCDPSLYTGFWRQYMPACVSVHDGYTLDVPKQLQGEAIDYLERLLTRPIYEMGGLRVGCEIEVGENWLEMESVKVVKV